MYQNNNEIEMVFGYLFCFRFRFRLSKDYIKSLAKLANIACQTLLFVSISLVKDIVKGLFRTQISFRLEILGHFAKD